MSGLVVWHLFLAILVGFGSIFFASRDPLATSWTKIAFAGAPLVCFAALLLLMPMALEGWLGVVIVAFGQAMLFGGAGVCAGVIAGSLFGMYLARRNAVRSADAGISTQ
jgi:hypothetical protein